MDEGQDYLLFISQPINKKDDDNNRAINWCDKHGWFWKGATITESEGLRMFESFQNLFWFVFPYSMLNKRNTSKDIYSLVSDDLEGNFPLMIFFLFFLLISLRFIAS